MTAIIRRSPAFLDEFERMAGEMFRTGLTPSLDIHEEKDELVVKAELPGVGKDGFDISLEGDVLQIKAEKKEEEVHEDTKYYAYERCFGQYYRSIALPFHVDADKVSATLENGVLEIRLPKAEESKRKHIEVKVR